MWILMLGFGPGMKLVSSAYEKYKKKTFCVVIILRLGLHVVMAWSNAER
jgi:hypothetical protein